MPELSVIYSWGFQFLSGRNFGAFYGLVFIGIIIFSKDIGQKN